MSADIPESLLEKFSQFVETHLGLHFPDSRLMDLHKGILGAAEEFGFKDIPACVEWLMSAPLVRSQIEILASHLTVGETYFFRDPRAFDILETEILPPLIESRRGNEQLLRIWSAGCCTGEEPYSIAILLHRLLPDLPDWRITILASDINPHFLKKAADGVFSNWSFRGLPEHLKETYFEQIQKGRFQIAPHIRRLVSFSYLNLVEDVYPTLTNNTNAMDVIFCRNVLMYFSPDRAKKAGSNLYRSLVDEGWLVTGPGETSELLCPELTPVGFPGAVLYRKAKRAAPPSRPGPFTTAANAVPAAAPPEGGAPRPASPGPAAPGGDAQALSFRARVCANEGRLAEALMWCQKSISANKLNPATHYLLGLILQEQEAPREAIAALKRALFLDHQFVIAHFVLGNLLLQQTNHREAGRCFENALQLLRRYRPGEILPESDGITAGRLSAIIESMKEELHEQQLTPAKR